MTDISETIRIHILGYLTELIKRQHTGIRCQAADNHLGVLFFSDLTDSVHVKPPSLFVNKVWNKMILHPTEVDWAPMGKMPTAAQVQSHEHVPKLQ